MLVELRKRSNHGKLVQEATVQKYLTVVSAVLSDAKRNEIIPENPAHMIDLPDTEKREQFIPSEEDANRFLNALLDEPQEYKIFYVLALYTGCRRGELCALKWHDFIMTDKYRCVLTVSRSRSHIPGQGVMEGPTKNGPSRTIVIEEVSLRCFWDIAVTRPSRLKRLGARLAHICSLTSTAILSTRTRSQSICVRFLGRAIFQNLFIFTLCAIT